MCLNWLWKYFSLFQVLWWLTFGGKNDIWENKDCLLSRFESFEHVNLFIFVSNFKHINLAINEKYLKFFLWQSKLLCFPYDLSNIQKCSLKVCPFTWVAPLIAFLPFYAICFGLYAWYKVKLKTIIFCI